MCMTCARHVHGMRAVHGTCTVHGMRTACALCTACALHVHLQVIDYDKDVGKATTRRAEQAALARALTALTSIHPQTLTAHRSPGHSSALRGCSTPLP